MHPTVHRLYRSLRRFSTIRAIPVIPLLLAAFWLFTIQRGERTVFHAAIAACDWSSWEDWPEDAHPHRAVLIADPQLVDPHTYPGRPWPLSSLTERYTDRYMARSYKIINKRHDPDSIFFLGDMFDGGREWAPSSAKPLNNLQKWQLEVSAPATTEAPKGYVKVDIEDPGWTKPGEQVGKSNAKRDNDRPIDLSAFTYGEGGRWEAYNNRQWESEYKRFGDIFLAPKQIYPRRDRKLKPFKSMEPHPINLENGARHKIKEQYAIFGGKTRDVLASLPGNHDLGFGSGVQMPVRARYKWHFGDMNRLDVIGNHTFVSIDALSLAAWSQYENNGQESTAKDAARRDFLYAPAQLFLNDLPRLSAAAAKTALKAYYPQISAPKRPVKTHALAMDADGLFTDFGNEARRRALPDAGLPAILLTHVPLYRNPDTACGPLREKGNAISVSGGYQYQNVLTPTLSNTIASKIQAIGSLKHVFSGDDHDYCDVTHTYFGQALQVREETVKSFSWAMGVRFPGFHMVSLWNPVDQRGQSLHTGSTIQTHLCLLPDQLGIFIHYITMALFTAAILAIRAAVLALRGSELDESDDSGSILPIIQGILPIRTSSNGKTNSKHRHRASSSGLKPLSNGNLGVQRSANARNRSVSPGVGLLQSGSPFNTPSKPLYAETGFYADKSDDEESKVGDMDYMDFHASQAKKWRRARPRGRLRRAIDEFVLSLVIVAGVALPYYTILISHG